MFLWTIYNPAVTCASNLVWIYWLILVVMRANIGIWSEHHQSYPRSPSHLQDTQPIPPSPSLDMCKLLLEDPASCLWNWLTSTQWQKIVGRVGEDWALSVIALFSVFILCTQPDCALEARLLCLIIICEDYCWYIIISVWLHLWPPAS